MDRNDIEADCRARGISPDETARIVDAYEESVADDRQVLEQIEENRRRKRGALRYLLPFGGALLLLGLGLSLMTGNGGQSRDREGEIAAELPAAGPELDALIAAMERKLRKPGRARDYRLLAGAYRARFEASGAQQDLEEARIAIERAETIERKKEIAMRKSPLLFSSLFAILIVGLIGIIIAVIYNGLAARDEMVDGRWSQVEAALQRRLDLIPNLVETVKGYAAHEAQTLSAVTEARARMISALGGTGGRPPADSAAALRLQAVHGGLGSALGRLLALVENYPDLKASQNFLSLQDQLEGTENRIAVERMRYNEAVRVFNARLRLFPYNVIGGLFAFEPRTYFESEAGAEKAVDVKF